MGGIHTGMDSLSTLSPKWKDAASSCSQLLPPPPWAWPPLGWCHPWKAPGPSAQHLLQALDLKSEPKLTDPEGSDFRKRGRTLLLLCKVDGLAVNALLLLCRINGDCLTRGWTTPCQVYLDKEKAPPSAGREFRGKPTVSFFACF